MVRELDIPPERIARIRCRLPKVGYALVADPIERKRQPKTVAEARFSFPYAAAVAAVHRQAGLEAFTPENISNPLIVGLMARVECCYDSMLDAHYPREWAAGVTLELVDGRELTRLTRVSKGDPLDPLSWEELLDKFFNLTIPVIGERKARAIVKTVQGLNEAQDLTDLMDLLA